MLRREQRYYTYIMTSLSGTLYTGVTNNIRHRVDKHKEGAGSQFTARYSVNRLVYFECFQYVNNAIAREKQIKGLSRAKKVRLIESMNPSWRDLSVDFAKVYQPQRSGLE
jgi:putative endonuclease